MAEVGVYAMQGRDPLPGDRVRVGSITGCRERAQRHWGDEVGMMGQVLRVSREGDATHPFDVRFDAPISLPGVGPGGSNSMTGSHYAAAELEILPE